MDDWELRRALKAWRQEQADERRLPAAYYVMSNKAIDSLVANKPKTYQELNRCAGIGGTIANKYGTALLAIIARATGVTSPVGIGAPPPPTCAAAGCSWLPEDERLLRDMRRKGEPVKAMATALGRSTLAIEMRLEHLDASAEGALAGEVLLRAA